EPELEPLSTVRLIRLFSSLKPSICTARCKSGFSSTGLFSPGVCWAKLSRSPSLLSDFLRVRELRAAEVAAGGHAFRAGEDGRERELQFARSQRNQFSERSQLGLLDHSSLQTLQAVEAPARMLEQPQQPLVEQVLLEENQKGQQRDTAHGHRKTDLAHIRLVVAQEQRPIGHDGQRKQGEFRKLRSEQSTGTGERRHHLGIAKAMPPGDGDPEEAQQSGEEREIV